MYSNPQKRSVDDTAGLRREAGHWLKELREARGLSQRQLAAEVGVEYYSFISQLETGHGRIPPDRYLIWAKALDTCPRDFVTRLMRFYDPVTYAILFGDSHNRRSAPPADRAEGGAPVTKKCPNLPVVSA
jgi:DNA-binding XRE family transcriptional regulator